MLWIGSCISLVFAKPERDLSVERKWGQINGRRTWKIYQHVELSYRNTQRVPKFVLRNASLCFRRLCCEKFPEGSKVHYPFSIISVQAWPSIINMLLATRHLRNKVYVQHCEIIHNNSKTLHTNVIVFHLETVNQKLMFHFR